MYLFFIIVAVFIVSLGLIFLAMKKRNFGDLVRSSFRFQLLAIKLPPEALVDDKKPLKEKISIAEQFISSLAGLNKPMVLEIAVSHIGEGVYFYLAIEKNSSEFIQKQIQGFFPTATIEPVEDYNIFNPDGFSSYAFLKQKENWGLPFRTYQEFEADSISGILNSFSQLKEEGEGLCLQIVFKTAPNSSKKPIIEAIKRLRQGSSVREALGSTDLKNLAKGMGSALGTIISPGEIDKEKEKEKQKIVVDETTVKSLENKLSKSLFYTNIRILSSAKNQERANEILNNMLGSFQQFGSPMKNNFIAVKPGKTQNFVFNYVFRNFNNKEILLLNAEELASFWHFPVHIENAPYASWVKTKEAPPPMELPEEGIILGRSIYRGQEKMVRILSNDRRRHIYSIGQTGTGKTYLMENLIIQDIQNGAGVCFIDPHGDSINTILSHIPQNRIDDVVVFDPGDLERPMGLNLFEYDFSHPEQKTFITNEFINIFDKLYDLKQTGGPMFEHYLRNAMGLIMSDTSEVATILDVQRVFTNEEYRNRKLSICSDPTIVEFWEKEAARITSGDISLQNITPYINSKFNTFVSNDYMRPIISQQKSAFNFRDIMDNKKILLINLSKGRIGDLNSSLLGLIFVGRILISALSRVDTPEEQRSDFYLYIDEFQNVTTPSISTILSEARKYRLCLYVAHQFIAQLEEKIRDAVFGNVGTIISFRVGVKDAEFLEKQFAPVFNQNDLINIDNFNAVIKLLVNNLTTRAFNFQPLTKEKGDIQKAGLIKELSRTKFGRDRLEVENYIREKYLKN